MTSFKRKLQNHKVETVRKSEPSTYELLLKRYEHKPLIRLDKALADWCCPMSQKVAQEKARSGDLPFPVTWHGERRSGVYLVPVDGLARWLDQLKQDAHNDFDATAEMRP